mgnify:CR=1 FL=1
MERTVETFFSLFMEELKQHAALRSYHKVANDEKKYLFRKAYLQQRFDYLIKNISGNQASILDAGCGYGTSSLLLAFMGYKKVVGVTLEYYFNAIEQRLEYWKKYIDNPLPEFQYRNLLTNPFPAETFDYIIVQDTLHHLEPINKALSLLWEALTKEGTIIVSEENGSCVFIRFRHFSERGFMRIKKIYDEQLGEYVLLGNENTRSLRKWKKLFSEAGFSFNDDSVEYIRFYPPWYFNKQGMERILHKERNLSKKNSILRKYFFFGINFTAKKNT